MLKKDTPFSIDPILSGADVNSGKEDLFAHTASFLAQIPKVVINSNSTEGIMNRAESRLHCAKNERLLKQVAIAIRLIKKY